MPARRSALVSPAAVADGLQPAFDKAQRRHELAGAGVVGPFVDIAAGTVDGGLSAAGGRGGTEGVAHHGLTAVLQDV